MLSPAAQQIIQNYLHLPFKDKELFCPYFINKKNKVRGALRALVGKGTPDEILEEATIYALKEKIDLTELNSEMIKKFLVDHYIGIDCSGFVYHVLDTELKTNKKPGLGKTLHFPAMSNLLKKIIIKLRPAENANVLTFEDPKNSRPVPLTDVKNGDVIILRDTGPSHTQQHIVLIHDTEIQGNSTLIIRYTHSIDLPEETWQEHGVRQGIITITNPQKSLLEQTWSERGKTGDENKFFKYATTARTIAIHRLHCLS
jgi:hypothetical protein